MSARPATFASPFADTRPGVALVGAGRMGRALGLRLVACGYPVRGVVSRSRGPAEALAAELGAGIASDRLADLPADAPLVALCVPDRHLADLAATLTRAPRAWHGAVVLHTSGALPASVLDPLRVEGADVLAFHPLQTVTPQASADTLARVFAGLEGSPRAVAAGVELAVGLGMRYVVLSADDRPRYHLAATMASNLVVALAGAAHEVLASIDIDRADAAAMLAPLLRGTLDALASAPPEDALTGPVARGDGPTLSRHGRALADHLPHLAPMYAALSVEAVRLAVRGGHLDGDRAAELLDVLVGAVAAAGCEPAAGHEPADTAMSPPGA